MGDGEAVDEGEVTSSVVVGGRTIDDTGGLDTKAVEVAGVVNSTCVEKEG